MQIKPGILLISIADDNDPLFEKVVVFIAEYNARGALGFVINKLFPRVFNELVEFKQSKPLSLYYGGPVEQEHLYFLHRRPDIIEDGTLVTGNIYMGGNFKQAVQLSTDGAITASDMQLFIGYCGWDGGQLEEEITGGSWMVIDNGDAYLFKHPNEIVWEDIFKRGKQ